MKGRESGLIPGWLMHVKHSSFEMAPRLVSKRGRLGCWDAKRECGASYRPKRMYHHVQYRGAWDTMYPVGMK